MIQAPRRRALFIRGHSLHEHFAGAKVTLIWDGLSAHQSKRISGSLCEAFVGSSGGNTSLATTRGVGRWECAALRLRGGKRGPLATLIAEGRALLRKATNVHLQDAASVILVFEDHGRGPSCAEPELKIIP